MSNILNKTAMMRYIDTYSGDLSLDQMRTKLSVMMGYYAGQSMDAVVDQGETFTSLFTRQWGPYEDIMVALNEIRPLDFDLAKSTAALVITARARVALGGLTHLYLKSTELSALDILDTTRRLLGAPVEPSEMVLFATTLDQFTQTPSATTTGQ